MAELYAKPYEVIDTGYNPQQTQQGGQDAEMQSYLESLPPEERQKAIERLNAPLTGEELALMAKSGQRKPTLEEFAEIEKFHKSHEVSFIEGLGKIAEGGEQVMTDLSNAFASFLDKPSDATSKMPATAVEAFAQGTRNFYGMLAQSQNTDSVLFRVKDFLNGTGTLEDRYNQYIDALEFNKQSADLAEGKQTLVMDKDMINHEVTQAMAYIADPTLFIPFGKVASTGLRAVGLGEKLTMAGARAAAIKNGIIGNTIKWGAGQPLEFMGGAVRNTIDYGLEKAGAAFEATTGISGKEFAQTARMSGVGFSASGIAGYAVPYASTVSDAYLVGSSAKGFGEALTLIGDTMKKNKFGRGINSWAAEALEQAEKNGVALSPHAKGLLKTLNAVDPLFAYGWNGLETAAEGAFIGGTLGYLSDNAEGMYSGIGAGIALGAVGGTAGKVVSDITGGTNVARRAVQAKMVIEGHKATNPEKAMFFQAMQKAAEIRGQDVDLVNGIIAGIDKVAPNFEFHALTPDQFKTEALKRGYNPDTGKFVELSAIDAEFGGDRASRSKAMSILRSIGGEFAGDRKAFLDALKKASSKDSADPTKPASNIPLSFRKYIDVAKSFEKLTKTQQEAILKEIDGQGSLAKELGSKTKLRDHYATLTWAEAWTDQLVKKFESDREGARKDITEMLSQETDKNGKLTRKGLALADKLRAEGFLDRDNKLLRERNLLNADLTYSNFKNSKGAVIERQADGKTHMYINLATMGSETFPHELFHTIMRESPMKKHFTDTLVHKLLGTIDKDGNLVRPAEVNIGQIEKFFKKYIDLTHRNDDGTLNAQEADAKFRQVQDALTEYRNAGENKKISDKARSLLENYTEEFGAYYFSHWLMGRNRNTLFFGGELKGIEGLVERAKDSFKDFWQSKISKSNPEFDFSRGLNEAFDRSKGLGRIGAMDYFMRDMVRAASNANKEVFRPDSMTLDNLRDFERSNGLRNLTAQGGTRRLNPREQVTQNIRLGKEAYKILSGLDKNLRTSKDVLDENGKQIITGRLSEAELDALVKGGIVPRAWADKVNQGYAMLDGTVSNIFSAGYLGRTEQTTDASYPRLTGKDVSFKNRKAVLFDVETKIKADGTFYTLFHTLDLAVIEQRANHLWQNVDYRNLWNGDRAAFEADFFRYISNASKASTDPKKLDSAALLETGDGNGAKRRDVMHQMAGMALQTGDAYKHQPIAVIPEGIRHSVTTFNIDGMTMPRVETGTRYDINMGNAHKFIRENWQPAEMRQEKTPSGTLMRHESGFKFSVANGKTTAFTSAGKKIGTFDSIKQATEAAKREYHKVYDNIDKAVRESVAEQDKNATKFQPLDENERAEAIRLGDVFALQSMKDFVGNRTLLRQTREEHIYQRALEAIENPEQLLAHAQNIAGEHLKISAEYDRLIADITKKDNVFEGEKNAWSQSYYKKLNELRDVKYGYPSSFEDWVFDQRNKGKWNPPAYSEGININPEWVKHNREAFARYEADAKAAWAKLTADPEYIESQKDYNQKTAYFAQRAKELIAERDLIDEFKKKNKEALENPLTTALDTLGQYSTAETTRAEKAGMFAKLVEANAKQKDYSGLLEALFASEYDDKIQTGKPFVAVTTHGTGNVELMLARLFAADKLGSHYDIPSSRMGSFSAGSQNTSLSYARKAPVQDLSTLGISKLVSNHSLKGAELVLNLENNLRDFFGKRYDILKDKANKAAEAYGEHKAYYEQNPHLGSHLANNEKGELLYSEWRSALAQAGYGLSRDAFIASEVRDFLKNGSNESWATQFAVDANKIAKYAVENNLLQSYPDKRMQLRKVIRMDNPYVVVDPRSYEEHHISPHMKRAIAAGHDGIIFKRFADGGQPDNVYVVFKDYMKDNIKVIDTSFDDVQVPRGNDETGRVLKGGKELNLAFQPTDEAEGGRVYDFNSPKFKSSFIGKYAEENPERLQNKNIEFVKRRDGSYRITMTDNSGATKKIGHITADLYNMRVKGEGIAEISSNIDPKFRGNKLANILYSEMAERLRAMGVKYVDGTIVNKDGIPVQVRNSVIGQTYYKGSNRPAFREDAAKQIQAVQSIYPSKGVGVYNELDFNARYQPDEAPLVDAIEMAEARRLGDLFKTKQMREFVGDRKVVPQTADEGFTDFINNFKQADINQQTALYMLDEMAKDMFGGLDRQTLKLKYNELIEKTLPAWFKKYPREKEYFERAKLNRGNDYTFNPEKHEVNLFTRLMSVEDANEFLRMYRELEKPVAEKQRHSDFTIATAEKFAKKIEEAKKWVKKANPQYNDFSGYLAENLPMREYYQHAVYSKKFRTGEPVVAVGVHGTNTSEGFLKEKKYRPHLRENDIGLSEGERRGAYFASSDETVLSKEYQGGLIESMGYEVELDTHRAESDSPNIAKSAIRFDNPLVVDGQQTPMMKRTEKILGEAIAAGHDGVIYINQMDGGGLDVSFILPIETVNRQQRMIGSTREKAMAGDAYEPLPRGEGLTNKTANLQPVEYTRLKQAAEKSFGMPIIEDATIAGLSSEKGYQGQFKSKSLLQGTFDSYKSLLDQSDARINKYAWKMQNGQKVFDRKQYERERSNYEEKRNKFLKYLQENGGVENVKILDVVKGNLKEYGIDRDTNWMTPSHKGGILTVDELFAKYESEFNRELEENKRYRKQYEETKAELDNAPLHKTFQTGKPVAVKAFHGSPYGEIKGNSFAPEMLGKYTKAASAKNAYFFAGSERTSRAYIEGGQTMSFDAKVPYDGWIELDYTERDAVEQAIEELHQVYKQGGGRASLDSYAQSIINDKYQFRDLVDSTLGTETFSTDKIKKGQVFPFFVKFDNPLVFDQGGESYREKSYFDLIQQAKKEGRDGVIILDTKDGGEYDIIYAVLPSHENNIKLAKTRTYDDQGKQIPLKQRFDLSSKDIRKQPDESEKAPINWVSQGYGKEGYNMEVIYMKPSRFLNLAKSIPEEYWTDSKSGKERISDVKEKMRKGMEMDRLYITIDRRDRSSEFYVTGHEGRHRAKAVLELYGDKYIPVEVTFNTEELKSINRGDYDFGKPESEKLAGSVSRKVLEDKPILNEDRTGRFMPAEYTEFKSEQSPMGRIMRNAKGYVITMANNKFRVYNPAKAILGVYGSEEEAKKRIYREIPKQ